MKLDCYGPSGDGDGQPATSLESGEDSNIVFRDSKGKVLRQPASISSIAKIDVYYI